MTKWIAKNRNQKTIELINRMVYAIVRDIDYDNPIEVKIGSILVRSLFKVREEAYLDGIKNSEKECFN